MESLDHSSISAGGDRRSSRSYSFAQRHLAVRIDEGLLVNAPDALDGAHVKRVLCAAIAGTFAVSNSPCALFVFAWPSPSARTCVLGENHVLLVPPSLRAPSVACAWSPDRGAATRLRTPVGRNRSARRLREFIGDSDLAATPAAQSPASTTGVLQCGPAPRGSS